MSNNKKAKVDWKVLGIAIAALALMETVALIKGIDGILLTFVVAAIAGIAGVAIRSFFSGLVQ